MDKYKHLLYNYNSYSYNNKDTSILYELALERGKGRGWYPAEWSLSDYISHIFKTNKTKQAKI